MNSIVHIKRISFSKVGKAVCYGRKSARFHKAEIESGTSEIDLILESCELTQFWRHSTTGMP